MGDRRAELERPVHAAEYRFLVAMMGSLGIGNNLNKWKDEDFTLATKMVALLQDHPRHRADRASCTGCSHRARES